MPWYLSVTLSVSYFFVCVSFFQSHFDLCFMSPHLSLSLIHVIHFSSQLILCFFSSVYASSFALPPSSQNQLCFHYRFGKLLIKNYCKIKVPLRHVIKTQTKKTINKTIIIRNQWYKDRERHEMELRQGRDPLDNTENKIKWKKKQYVKQCEIKKEK